MIRNLFAFVICLSALYATEKVDLICYCPLLMPQDQLHYLRPDLIPVDSFPMIYKRVREQYDFRAFHNSYEYVSRFHDKPNLKKIIYFEYWTEDLQKLPKSKLIFFKWEAKKIDPVIYDQYSIVYTIDDDLIDGKKFFKFYYPALLPMISDRTPFQKKRLCTMVLTNWTEDRIKILDFFETKPKEEFEFYGNIAFPFFLSERYKGPIPGYHSGLKKIRVLDQYRFGICFENTHSTRGYITEKIFNYFSAGTIPIYWGPDNILEYIPKDCFIDYRDFSSAEEMYRFMKEMDESTYEGYIERIKAFLTSPAGEKFSPEHFDKTLIQAIQR